MRKKLFIMALVLSAFVAQAQQITPTDSKTVQDDKKWDNPDYSFHNDWASIRKYDADNMQLLSGPPDPNRIVFFGNSITEFWKGYHPAYFGPGHINRGISGQTTPQMLVRFRQDVINLKPALVVILAGINDIAQNTGPIKSEDTFGNIVSMVQLARAANIKVVMCSILPANHFPWRPSIIPTEKIIQINLMLKDYADANHIVYLDYYPAMVDDQKGMQNALSADGVHPNLAGYKIMEPLADQAIAKALQQQ